MATAIINGIAVSGSVEEIHLLIQKATTQVTTAASTLNLRQLEGMKNAKSKEA